MAIEDKFMGSADVAVIGGGISGLALAIAAAEQGLRVTVLEANDFGGGATANSSRIVHGGLRYLQTLNIWRARRSIRARRELMRLAPDLVRPIECRIPISAWGLRSRLPMTIACLLADALGWDKNAGLSHKDRLPGSNVWRRIFLYPCKDKLNNTPAIGWWDAVLSEPHRFIARLLGICDNLGINLINHAPVTELVVNKEHGIDAVLFHRAVDSSSSRLEVRGVVDTSGYGGRSFRRKVASIQRECDWVGAANFLLDEQPPSAYAIGLRAHECYGSAKGTPEFGKWRDFFFVPTHSGVLAGTTYTLTGADTMPELAKSRAYQQLLDEINRARPDHPIEKSDIKHYFWGMLPAAITASGSASSRLLDQDLIVDGEKKYGLPGYYRVQGVKLTTAFELAYRVVPMLLRYRSNANQNQLENSRSIDLSKMAEAPAVFSLTTPANIKKALGKMRSEEIRDLVSYCVRREYAQTLEDLLQRRLGLLPFDYPCGEVRRILAYQLAAQLGWDNIRIAQELAQADSTVEASRAGSLEAAVSPKTVVGL